MQASMETVTGVPEADVMPVRHGLVGPFPGSRFLGWAGPVLVTIFGGFLRFDRLGSPHAVVFDETYYVPDSFSTLHHGVELQHVKNVNALLAAGNPRILQAAGEYVAHPPLGKVMIAIGEWLFGLTPFGWRFSVAVVGSLAILMTARIARRITRSTLLGCVAGLLLALDGLELVLSRTAILDIFVMFWVLAAFGLLVIDRDLTRTRIANVAPSEPEFAGQPNASGGPKLGIRWLRVLAGICLGLACGTKWNAVWYIPAFGALAIAWDYGARCAAGFGNFLHGTLRSDVKWLPVWCAAVPAAAYTACWTGWFVTAHGYDRDGTALNGGHPASTIVAWYQYNKSMLRYGLGLNAGQPYRSDPLGWLVLARPISFYVVGFPKNDCCKPTATVGQVLAIGTPLLWWGGAAAMFACLLWWIARRDWRAGAVLVAVAAGWLPWIWFYFHDDRTEFYYYAVVFDPFIVIAIVLCLGLVIGRVKAAPGRRATGAVLAGAYLLAVLANFAYMYPILTAEPIQYSSWLSRMWFKSWI
jgi:dolichyl-phosphate-mannose-protein mannosyltransferase